MSATLPPDWFRLSPEVEQAFQDRRPIVALESTLIAHGLPWPTNLETAERAEAVVREAGATPATIAVLDGHPTVGLSRLELERLAHSRDVRKASQRDLAAAMLGGATAATTVSATMALAHLAGIRVFATGGIGGAHPRPYAHSPFDISSDITELSRTAVLVVCAGAKSILDLPQTLELLETFNVPVVGFRTGEFPTFYVRSEDRDRPGQVSARVETPKQAAAFYETHRRLGGRGVLLVQPVEEDVAVPLGRFNAALQQAESEAQAQKVGGAKLTPFLLARLADLTVGQTLAANRTLIVANARLAAEVAASLTPRG